MRIPLSETSVRRFHARIVMMTVGAALAIGVVSATASAMPAPIQVAPGKVTQSIRAGLIAGGQASDEFSLLGIRHEVMSDGKERLVLNYGDRMGKPLKGEPGFFQVALDRESRRIVIDLAQVNRTAVDARELTRILAPSKLMTVADMTMDPHDSSTNITLTARAPVALSVAAETGGQGKLVIEIREASDAAAGGASGGAAGGAPGGVKP